MKDILFLIGSESDRKLIEPAIDLIKEKQFSYTLKAISAHRNLAELLEYLKNNSKSFRVIIAAAGLSAALPGIVASQTKVPVIGVPLSVGELSGIDALLSMLQLPKGVPMATMGIGIQGLLNAVYFAERIISH
ncbi:MAG: 5-(carboxyamino)imidazole ribonucleotide mutase [Spirochaetes bacterium]|nr:MAG: 5-(carboxyamino)imidazole ribonucleotide mutase [Spirochaetota bacterium]